MKLPYKEILKSNTVKNGIWLYILQFFNTVFPLLTLPYVTRILGTNGYGIFSYALNIITYLACICFIFIVGRIFIVPLKKILKLIINSIFGGLMIYVINLIGANFGFHIGLNIINSLIIGLLGLPGAVCLIIVKLLIG